MLSRSTWRLLKTNAITTEHPKGFLDRGSPLVVCLGGVLAINLSVFLYINDLSYGILDSMTGNLELASPYRTQTLFFLSLSRNSNHTHAIPHSLSMLTVFSLNLHILLPPFLANIPKLLLILRKRSLLADVRVRGNKN